MQRTVVVFDEVLIQYQKGFMVAPTLSPLTEMEAEWISGLSHGLCERRVADTVRELSEYFAAQRDTWFAAAPESRADPNDLINSVGAVVGDVLVRGLDLQWVVATDEIGTELAVHGQPADIVLYPMNAVAKHWTGEAAGTLEDYVSAVFSRVSEIRAAAGGA